MGLADKLQSFKKEDYDKANVQAGTYLSGKEGQTGTDYAQETYKQYQATKSSNSATTAVTDVDAITDKNYSSQYYSSTNHPDTNKFNSEHYGPTPTAGYDGQPTGENYSSNTHGPSETAASGYGSSGYGSSIASSTGDNNLSSHIKKHVESVNHPGFLARYETGVSYLDAKLAKLPENLQKEAHNEFQRGYNDAKKEFKH